MMDASGQPHRSGDDERRTTVRLLIVGDNPKAREMTRFYVRDLADEIRECEGGVENVLTTMAEFMPAWVVMEVYLKETDGFALIRRISADHPLTKIVVMTNRTDEQTRRAAIGNGAFAFFGTDDLLALTDLLKLTQP